MKRLSKLDWISAVVRDRRLKPAEKVTAIALAEYTNSRTLGGAHPGRQRLSEDCDVAVRTIERHLATLSAFGWIKRTSLGSVSAQRNWADTYALTVSTSRQADVDWSGGERVSNGVTDQSTNRDDQSTNVTDQSTPGCRPNRFSTSGSSHPSDSSESGSIWRSIDINNWDEVEEALEEMLQLSVQEASTALGMWTSEAHPQAIVNKINKDREADGPQDAWADGRPPPTIAKPRYSPADQWIRDAIGEAAS